MPEEITSLREELTALRAELTELRRDHQRLLDKIGLLPDEEGGPNPRYLQFDAGCFGVRNSEMWLPIFMRAHEDHAALVFMDRNHCVRAELIVDDTGFRMETRNSQHQLTFQLAEGTDGTGQLCVCDAEGDARAGMRVNEYGGVINVVDKQQKPQAFLIGTAQGGEIFAVNAMHNASATMKATNAGGIVCVHEPSGQLMGFLSATTETGGVSIYGPHGSLAAGMIATEEGGGIVFNDIDGNPRAQLPQIGP